VKEGTTPNYNHRCSCRCDSSQASVTQLSPPTCCSLSILPWEQDSYATLVTLCCWKWQGSCGGPAALVRIWGEWASAQLNCVCGAREPQHIARDLFNEVGGGPFGAEERDISQQMGAHGFKALDLELQHVGAVDQSCASLKTVSSCKGMADKVHSRECATKQNKELLQSGLPVCLMFTLHNVRCF
jgi:hypothetical protein